MISHVYVVCFVLHCVECDVCHLLLHSAGIVLCMSVTVPTCSVDTVCFRFEVYTGFWCVSPCTYVIL